MADRHKSRDLFSLLPSELITLVFNLAYHEARPPHSPISRHLYPFQQTALYRRVELYTAIDFEKFVKIIVDNPQIGELIRELKIVNDDYLSVTSTISSYKVIEVLPEVEILSLGPQCPWLAAPVCHPHGAKFLRKLRQLNLDWSDTYPPCFIRDLNSYPTLNELNLRLEPNLEFDETFYPSPPLLYIDTLSISHKMVDTREVGSYIKKTFPSLRKLTLESKGSEAPDYAEALEELPKDLASLTLLPDPAADYNSQEMTPCNESLRPFVELTYLYLGVNTFDMYLELTLSRLPLLSTLGFGRKAFTGIHILQDLASGPHRLRSLKTLILDQYSGKMGTSLEVNIDDNLKTIEFDAPDWILPHEQGLETFDEDEYVPFCKVLEEAGVSIEGTVVEAHRVMRAYRRKQKLWLIGHCSARGDWKKARFIFGDEWVDAVLLGIEYAKGADVERTRLSAR